MTTPAHNRKLKKIVLTIGGITCQAQVKTWKMNNNTDDPEIFATFEPGADFAEEAEPSYALEFTAYSDWRPGGISRFLWEQRGQTVDFVLDHQPDIPGEHVRWDGQLFIKAPSAGGDIKTTEQSEVVLTCVGEPNFTAF